MKIHRVQLRNFRCHMADTSIEIGNMTAIVGRNDSGKSSILDALEIFFDDSKKPDADDATKDGDPRDCLIACEFTDLPSGLVIDSDFATTLRDEFLLNENGRLEIHKLYDCSLKTPKLKEVYARAIHPAEEKYDDLHSLKSGDLRKRLKELKADTTDVNLSINAQMRRAIWNHKKDLVMAERFISLSEEGGKSVWEQISKHMPLFQIFRSDRPSTDQDEEAQDPMKLAVKEALKAKEEELKHISDEVEKQVREIAEATVVKIREMDPKLAQELHPLFTPPKWDSIFKISLTDDAQIPINKRGSGVRRLILLNFFRAKAERMVQEKDATGVVYAIEEPETSQHPEYQRMLLRALQELSETHGCQVIITTHTPNLARQLPLETLRYIECGDDGTRTIHHATEETYKHVVNALGVLPDNDIKLFLGVEGINDISFLQNISRILAEGGEEDIPNLIALESRGHVVFIPQGGQSLANWVGRLKGLRRPEYHLFDREVAPPKQPVFQRTVDKINDQEGCSARSTERLTLESYLHPDAIRECRPSMTLTLAEFDDVPVVVAQALHEADDASKPWDSLDDRKRKSKISSAKKWLNDEAVRRMTPERLTECDPDGHLRGWLREIAALLA